jgi:hypothetical protein
MGMLNAAVKFPVEAAYDTVTVARKPHGVASPAAPAR